MANRIGNTIILKSKPKIIANAAIVGKKEGDGPLGKEFDMVFGDTTLGEDSWEKSESMLLKNAVQKAMSKADITENDLQVICSGDLLNQCIGSTFALRDLSVPFCGLYGACSTMALTLCTLSLMIESEAVECGIAATSSHFCSAERQFRHPLEYAGQRPPTAQWTVTGSGAIVLKKSKETSHPYIDKIHIGTIEDLGVTDANNMGAAMAPAVRKIIAGFLKNTVTRPTDYYLILTGDLGLVGSTLLKQLLLKEDDIDISSVHKDCGLMIYDREKQDVHAGGSGCGCSGSVLCSHILNGIRKSEKANILFVATGALMSTASSLQGESIPSVAHLVNIKKGDLR